MKKNYYLLFALFLIVGTSTVLVDRSYAQTPAVPPANSATTTANTIPVTSALTNVPTCEDGFCYETYSGVSEALGEQFNQIKQTSEISGFINAIIAFVTATGGVIAVIMIMYEGFRYMSTDNVSAKGDARTRIVHTVAGLLLLLSIYTLLRTINPDLLVLMPQLQQLTIEVEEGDDATGALDKAIEKDPLIKKIYGTSKGHWRDGGRVSPDTEAARKALANSVPSNQLYDLQANGLTIKTSANKLVHSSVGPKLAAMNTSLKGNGVSIIVTEGFKPTIYRHKSSCHYTATCIDADIVPFNVNKVALLISEAQKAGLVAVWETTKKADYVNLIKAGVPETNVLLFSGHITGDHASVYDYKP